MGKLLITDLGKDLEHAIRQDERVELGRALEHDGIETWVRALVGGATAKRLWARHGKEMFTETGANPKPLGEDIGWWCNVAKAYLSRPCGPKAGGLLHSAEDKGCGWAKKPSKTKSLADLFGRRWYCGVTASGYHNGGGCQPADPHDSTWRCGWRWQAPALTDKQAKEYGLEETW